MRVACAQDKYCIQNLERCSIIDHRDDPAAHVYFLNTFIDHRDDPAARAYFLNTFRYHNLLVVFTKFREDMLNLARARR